MQSVLAHKVVYGNGIYLFESFYKLLLYTNQITEKEYRLSLVHEQSTSTLYLAGAIQDNTSAWSQICAEYVGLLQHQHPLYF